MLRLNARDNVYRYSRSIHAVEQSDGSYISSTTGYIYWYNEEGDIHREDGPAIYGGGSGDIYWYINGTKIYTFNEWIKLTPISDEQKMLLRLQYV